MSFQRWSDYVDVLDRIRERVATWGGARTFTEFDRLIRVDCADVVREEDYGYEALVAALDTEFSDRDRLFEQLSMCAKARPAADAGLTDAGWAGYFVSTRNGEQVYAADRFAATSDWVPLNTAAEESRTADEAVEIYDGENHLDAATNRWRRWHETDGEFEFHHAGHDVWERHRHGLWYRYFDDRLGWIAYDEASDTWLDPTTPPPAWRTHGEVGVSPVVAEAARVFEQMPEEHQAVLSDLAQRAIAMKPVSMSEEDALRILGEAVSAEVAEIPTS